jgi:hypothetical protein
MGKMIVFAFIAVVAYPANAQVGSGSVVIFQLTKDKFVIAADSRVTLADRPPTDDECKIVAFASNRVIYANTGGNGYTNRGIMDSMPSWSAVDEARSAILAERAIEPTDAMTAVNRISAVWENSMLTRWSQQMSHNAEGVISIASKYHGGLTNGIFVAARRGSIAIALTGIVLDNGVIKVVRPTKMDCEKGPCGSGEMDVFNKYTADGKEFMKADSKNLKSFELIRTVRLVDLTIAEDKSGTVHGPIDSLELLKAGSVRWHQRKCTCPKSSD